MVLAIAVIGILISIGALTVSFKAYNFAKSVKATDLRIQLKKQNVDICKELDSLPKYINDTHLHQVNSFAATGRINSGSQVSAENNKDKYLKKLSELERFKNNPSDITDSLTIDEIEALLVNAHIVMNDLHEIRSVYQKIEIECNENSRHLRDAAQLRMNR